MLLGNTIFSTACILPNCTWNDSYNAGQQSRLIIGENKSQASVVFDPWLPN